jgi:nicotinate dehydrogenase subunit A
LPAFAQKTTVVPLESHFIDPEKSRRFRASIYSFSLSQPKYSASYSCRTQQHPKPVVMLCWPKGTGEDMSTISLRVNGRAHVVDVDPETPLLYVLSDELHLRGPKFGCGLGQCGACTVMMNGSAVRSCITPVAGVGHAEVVTLEGLGTPEKPHPIQQAFIDQEAAQCGFCLSGVILSAKAFLDRNPKATDDEIRQALAGVLCRCFVHARMFKAIQQYAKTRHA